MTIGGRSGCSTTFTTEEPRTETGRHHRTTVRISTPRGTSPALRVTLKGRTGSAKGPAKVTGTVRTQCPGAKARRWSVTGTWDGSTFTGYGRIRHAKPVRVNVVVTKA